jgi:hypothetical protein
VKRLIESQKQAKNGLCFKTPINFAFFFTIEKMSVITHNFEMTLERPSLGASNITFFAKNDPKIVKLTLF